MRIPTEGLKKIKNFFEIKPGDRVTWDGQYEMEMISPGDGMHNGKFKILQNFAKGSHGPDFPWHCSGFYLMEKEKRIQTSEIMKGVSITIRRKK